MTALVQRGQVYNPLEGERPDLTLSLRDGTDEQITIAVIHKDRPEYLNMCLQSIAVTSINNNYEIVVVDNGSTKQDAIDYLEDLKKEPYIKVVRNEKNRWWSAAANQAAKAADKNSKYLVFMHCDVIILNPAWLDLLINVSESGSTGCIGIQKGAYKIQEQKIEYIQEWLLMVTRECWRDCGPFPEELPQIGAPFIFSFAANLRGYRPQVLDRVPIAHHYQIFSIDANDYEKMTEDAMTALPRLIRETQTKR